MRTEPVLEDGEVKIPPYEPYISSKPSSGAFGCFYISYGTDKKTGKVDLGQVVRTFMWMGCRNGFHSAMTTNKMFDFYFVHHCDVMNVAHFILQIENHFGLRNYTKFSRTNDPNVVYVNPSTWWRRNKARYMFFSICLRSSQAWINGTWKDRSWRELLFRSSYISTTPLASNRFLDGYTLCKDVAITGWVRKFSLNVRDFVEKELINPDDRHDEISEMAYLKWEQSGKPDGMADEFWRQATEEYDSVKV